MNLPIMARSVGLLCCTEIRGAITVDLQVINVMLQRMPPYARHVGSIGHCQRVSGMCVCVCVCLLVYESSFNYAYKQVLWYIASTLNVLVLRQCLGSAAVNDCTGVAECVRVLSIRVACTY